MPFRKMKQKKFKGVYEYYRGSDHDKVTTAYYISVRDNNNKPRKIKTSATTPEEAVVALAHYKVTRTKQASTTSKHKHTLETFSKLYFGQRIAVDNKNEQQKFEKNIFEFINKRRPIKSICKEDLEVLQKSLQSKGFANHYTNILVTMLSSLVKWGFEEGYIVAPLPSIKKLDVDNHRLRVLTDKELEAIYSRVPPKYRMFLRLMYYTAQRPRSILELKRKDILESTIVIKGIKKGKTHQVPISPKIKNELSTWIEDLEPDDYVVAQKRKNLSYAAITYHTKPEFKKLFNQGLDYRDEDDRKKWVSLYTLRHTSLTRIYNATGDIYVTQKMANHSDPKMTQRYAKVADETKTAAVGVL